jgi:uncharacterized membrane protein
MHDAHAPRLGTSLVAIAIGVVLIAAILLMPDLTPSDAVPVVGQQNDRGRVLEELPPDPTGLPRFAVEILDGPEAGRRVDAVVQDASGAVPGSSTRDPYRAGDEVVVTSFTGPAGGFAVISEPWRVPLLAVMTAIFAAVVLVIGGLRGARSLVALALTLAIVVKVVVPLLLRGYDPILLAVGVAAVVTVITLLLTEGAGRVTLSASLGTPAAAEFSALQGSEEIAFLVPLIGDRIDLQGILLAATVFGALGVLDDVTVTQAATVEQLRQAQPAASRAAVIGHAMRVGRSHIAATVNTLVLAYLGAGLPLLLLFALSGQPQLSVLNGEIVAVEVVRALVGSIGIVAAVPLTTLVAGILMVPAHPTEPVAA